MVLASRPVVSLKRLAARPVGAARDMPISVARILAQGQIGRYGLAAALRLLRPYAAMQNKPLILFIYL